MLNVDMVHITRGSLDPLSIPWHLYFGAAKTLAVKFSVSLCRVWTVSVNASDTP